MEWNSELKVLHALRQEAKASKEEVDRAWQVVADMPEYAYWQQQVDKRKAADSTLSNFDALMRAAMVAHYNETGEKKPAPGLEVKVSRVLSYDLDKAFAYCIENMTGALSLNTKVFEKIMLAIPDTRPGWISIADEPKATVALDLSAVVSALP
jgi:hypothetical protein